MRRLAEARLREAQVLLDAKEWSGAYYLAGYAVECSLKAVVLRNVSRYVMPHKQLINDSHTHSLTKLLTLAELREDQGIRAQRDKAFERHWAYVERWSEESRYLFWTHDEARDMLLAITQRGHGVFPWIKSHW